MNNRWVLRGLLVLCTGLPLASCSGPQSRTEVPQPLSPADSRGDSSAPSVPLGRIDSSTAAKGSTAGANTAAGPNGAPTQDTAAAQALASQCDSLRADIREAQNSERYAPTTSVDENIVAATEAKDDQRIADLQQQYDQLGCPSADLPATHERLTVPPPAPGGLPP